MITTLSDLAAHLLPGASALAVAGLVLARVLGRLITLIELRMILRSLPESARLSAVLAHFGRRPRVPAAARRHGGISRWCRRCR